MIDANRGKNLYTFIFKMNPMDLFIPFPPKFMLKHD